MRKVLLIGLLICVLTIFANAQFNSGSTGADGALDLSTMSCNIQGFICEVQLPESGVLNYTTVNIPNGKGLIFKKNFRNTPVILLAQGNVNISGSVWVSVPADYNSTCADNQPGPGGFYGGSFNKPGFGPGGGAVGQPGSWVGSLSLVPITGGSGGGGNSNVIGGGGGGAIIIASSTSISHNGSIRARSKRPDCGGFLGPVGSGGAIRLIANSIVGSGSIEAYGIGGPSSSFGIVRLEALFGQLNYTGNSTPLANLVPFTAQNVPTISTNALPQLTIVSIGGYAIPYYTGSSFGRIDLILPTQIPDPINVVVAATNIPTGSQVSVGFVSGSPNATSVPCNLAGTPGSSQCTATISSLDRTVGNLTYLLATVTFTLPSSLAQYNPKGENQVANIRLQSGLDGKTKYVFLRSDGKVVDNTKLSKEFLKYFGM